MFLTMNSVDFGEWLRTEREKKEWSQSDLSRYSGLHRAVISKIEGGTRPMPETLTALAQAFKMSPIDIFEKAGLLPAKAELSPIKRKLMHLAEGLPDSDVEIAVVLLEQREGVYKKNPSAKPVK